MEDVSKVCMLGRAGRPHGIRVGGEPALPCLGDGAQPHTGAEPLEHVQVSVARRQPDGPAVGELVGRARGDTFGEGPADPRVALLELCLPRLLVEGALGVASELRPVAI